MPTPMAGPLIAAMIGFLMSMSFKVSWPAVSRGTPSDARAASLLSAKVSGSRSAPAQKARPAPVTMTARTSSSLSAMSAALINSSIIVFVQAFSRSGRFKVTRAMPFFTS